MKKLASLILSFALLLSLCACGGEGGEENGSASIDSGDNTYAAKVVDTYNYSEEGYSFSSSSDLTYNPDGSLKSANTSNAGNPDSKMNIQSISYSYDDMGRVSSVSYSVDSFDSGSGKIEFEYEKVTLTEEDKADFGFDGPFPVPDTLYVSKVIDDQKDFDNDFRYYYYESGKLFCIDDPITNMAYEYHPNGKTKRTAVPNTGRNIKEYDENGNITHQLLWNDNEIKWEYTDGKLTYHEKTGHRKWSETDGPSDPVLIKANIAYEDGLLKTVNLTDLLGTHTLNFTLEKEENGLRTYTATSEGQYEFVRITFDELNRRTYQYVKSDYEEVEFELEYYKDTNKWTKAVTTTRNEEQTSVLTTITTYAEK